MILKRKGANTGYVTRSWHKIIGKVRRLRLAFGIVDKILEEHAAEALYHGAYRLAHECYRIDDPTDILNCDVVDHLDMPDLGVNRDVNGMRAVGPGVFIIVELFLDVDPISSDFGDSHCLAPDSGNALAVDDFDLVCGARPAIGGGLADLGLETFGRF